MVTWKRLAKTPNLHGETRARLVYFLNFFLLPHQGSSSELQLVYFVKHSYFQHLKQFFKTGLVSARTFSVIYIIFLQLTNHQIRQHVPRYTLNGLST